MVPTSVELMSYNSVILVGVVTLTAFWWFVHGMRKYPGPKLAHEKASGGRIVSLAER